METCNICGSAEFLPGPGGRMARSGTPPCCAGCGSLERHRGLRALLAPLPPEFFASTSAMVFAPERAPDRSLDPQWFRSFRAFTALAPIPATDASAGFLSFSHMLEFEADDQAAFEDLWRVGNAQAVVQITFASAMTAAVSTKFDPPKPPYGRYWDYGQDVMDRFAVARRGLKAMRVMMSDPVTQTSEPAHFFCRRAEDSDFLAGQFERCAPGSVRKV